MYKMGAAVSRASIAGGQQVFRSRYVLNRVSGSMVVGHPQGEVSVPAHYQSNSPYYMAVAAEHQVPLRSAMFVYNTAAAIAQTPEVRAAIEDSAAFQDAARVLETQREEDVARLALETIEEEELEMAHQNNVVASTDDGRDRIDFCPHCRSVLPVSHESRGECYGEDAEPWVATGDAGMPGRVAQEAGYFSVVLVVVDKLSKAFPGTSEYLTRILDSAWDYFMRALSLIVNPQQQVEYNL